MMRILDIYSTDIIRTDRHTDRQMEGKEHVETREKKSDKLSVRKLTFTVRRHVATKKTGGGAYLRNDFSNFLGSKIGFLGSKMDFLEPKMSFSGSKIPFIRQKWTFLGEKYDF